MRTTCTCGTGLPTHLAKMAEHLLSTVKKTHHCSCGRNYSIHDGDFYENATVDVTPPKKAVEDTVFYTDEDRELADLLVKADAAYAELTPEEQEEHRCKQEASLVYGQLQLVGSELSLEDITELLDRMHDRLGGFER